MTTPENARVQQFHETWRGRSLADLDLKAQSDYFQSGTRLTVEAHRAEAAKALRSIDALTTAQRKRARLLVCRCPMGCVLVSAYPRRPPWGGDGELLLVVAETRRGRRARFNAWPHTDDMLNPDLWLPVSCRHGEGRFSQDVATELIYGWYEDRNERTQQQIVIGIGRVVEMYAEHTAVSWASK